MSDEKSGCLFVLFHLLGLLPRKRESATHDEAISEAEIVELPYRVRDDFLSPAERSFYAALLAALNGKAVVCPKVRLGDILFAADRKDFWKHTNRVNQKHVDFLVCSLEMKPRCAIELDDASHQREAAQERDQFKDAAFAAAGLPLVRIQANRSYDVEQLAAKLLPVVQGTLTSVVRYASLASTSQPTCPKCGVPMVKRTANRGGQAGKSFFGCPNFPRCRETTEAT